MSKKTDRQFTELTEMEVQPSSLVVTVDFCTLLVTLDDDLARVYTVIGELKDLLR